jgi:uncharacterized protein (DUF433 family)
MKLREPSDTSAAYPHIRIRTAAERDEPFVQGTGLAVWEIVWISRAYGGNSEKTRQHLDIDSELIDEALNYASVYPKEIERTIQIVETTTAEDLAHLLPGIRVIDFESNHESETPS